MSSGNNDIPTFEYKPEYRQEMESILVKRKSKKRFLLFLSWTLGGLFLAFASFYFLQKDQLAEEINIADTKVKELSNNESESANPIKKEQTTIESPIFVTESIKKQEVKAQNFPQSIAQLKQKNKKSNAQESLVNAPEQIIEKDETIQNEIQVTPNVSSEQNKNDSLSEIDSAIAIVEKTDSFLDSLVSSVQKADTLAADTLAKVQMDSIAKQSAHQWIFSLGVGGNNSIGEGEYNNGIAPSFKLGVNYIHEFSKGHSVGIGLQGKLYKGMYNWGGYDTVKMSIANPNSSGYDKMEARVVTHNQNKYAMALSLPLYYQYSTPKYSFSVGASVDYLLANLYEQTTDTSKYGINTFVFYTEVFVDKTSGAKVKKQDFTGINRLNFGPFIEVDYHLSPKISMGLIGQMLVQDITNNSIVNINKNSPLYSLNVSLKYHFSK